MRILVFMSDNRSIDPDIEKASYNSLVASINYEYCKKHKYDFLYYVPYNKEIGKGSLYNCIDPNSNTVRHAAWSKLLSTKLALEMDYNYVVYIDSDCIFKDFEQTIEQFIEPFKDKDIMFLNNKPWGDHLPCSGFFVLKVNEQSKRFINDWYNVNIPEKNEHHEWEQCALWKIYKMYNIGIIDSWMFKEVSGQYLRHVASYQSEKRIPYFQNFIKEREIDHLSNVIKNIEVIEFSTT